MFDDDLLLILMFALCVYITNKFTFLLDFSQVSSMSVLSSLIISQDFNCIRIPKTVKRTHSILNKKED